MRKKWYHASPRRLCVGTLLSPHAGKRNFKTSESTFPDHVFITDSPVPHFTVLDKAIEGGWHVYEVEPQGKIEFGMWDDAICPFAKVISYVGTARGIVNAKKRRSPKKEIRGSMVSWYVTSSQRFKHFCIEWDAQQKRKEAQKDV